jgi:2-haloacid dehalogenase
MTEDIIAAGADRAPTAGQGQEQGQEQGQGTGAGVRPAAFIFDVFGTCVDWRAGVAAEVGRAVAAKGAACDPGQFADAWRNAYDPAMAPIRAGLRGYVALDDLHRENLETVLRAHDLGDALDGAERAALARAWEKLPAWADVPTGLARLKALGPVAPCSNGSIALMVHLARFAHLPWDCVLGAEIAETYKPEAAVYLAACAALRLAPAQVMMIACHPDDLDAAAAAGLRTGYVPRPREWGEAASPSLITLDEAEARFDLAGADFHALADALGG